MIRLPPRSTLFPTRRSSDLVPSGQGVGRGTSGAGMGRCFPSPTSDRVHRDCCRTVSVRAGLLVLSREGRSEEHTSELQSPDHLVCRLLLEKKKKEQKINTNK